MLKLPLMSRSLSREEQLDLALDFFNERAAILEYDAGFSREAAEHRSAVALGFATKEALLNYLEEERKSLVQK